MSGHKSSDFYVASFKWAGSLVRYPAQQGHEVRKGQGVHSETKTKGGPVRNARAVSLGVAWPGSHFGIIPWAFSNGLPALPLASHARYLPTSKGRAQSKKWRTK